MGHLTTDELVDLAESAQPESSAPHLRSCDACRQQLADLRATLAVAAEIETPEPSPLFWDHLSARVHDAIHDMIHDAIEAEGESGRSTLFGRSAATVAAWVRMHPSAIGALAVLVVVVGLFLPAGLLAPASPVAPETAFVDIAPDIETDVATDVATEVATLADDPSLSLVADLAADLDWESAREAGLITHAGAGEDAMNLLTAAERRELRQLLQGELSRGRGGA